MPFLHFFGVVLFVEESLLPLLSYRTACWRVNQSSVLPCHATTTSQAGIPHDGLLRTPKDPICGAFESERNHGYRFMRTQSQHHIRVGILAGKAPLSVHQSQEDMGEVRAWQIQGIIRPLSSLQLSLTRLVGRERGGQKGIHDLSL